MEEGSGVSPRPFTKLLTESLFLSTNTYAYVQLICTMAVLSGHVCQIFIVFVYVLRGTTSDSGLPRNRDESKGRSGRRR